MKGNISDYCYLNFIFFLPGTPTLWVDPYPAIIYKDAPLRTPVLNVHGFVRGSEQTLANIGLTSSPGAEYFALQQQNSKMWILFTNRTIDKPINYTFEFRVYGTFDNFTRDRQIEILVTKKNIHPPVFTETHYALLVHRHALTNGLVNVGTLKATDSDEEEYNSIFQYFLTDDDDNFAKDYFAVGNLSGKITALQDFPQHLNTMSFSAMALDEGSPQLTGYTNVSVHISDVMRKLFT